MSRLPEVSREPSENWANDDIQFPRLIAEAESSGLWDKDNPRFQELLESMDLEIGDFFELVDRAQTLWDELKARL